MNMPGFTAEAAIYKNTGVYRQSPGGALSADAVTPQLIWDGGRRRRRGRGNLLYLPVANAFSMSPPPYL